MRKRAKIEKLSEADYLRICMIVDAVLAGDRDAIKITAGRLREKFLARVRRIPHWADDLRGTPGLRRIKAG